MNWTNKIRKWSFSDGVASCAPVCPTRDRLAQAFKSLGDIQVIRDELQNPRFEVAIEERIVWRELLELELQEVDARIDRILAAAGNG